MKQQFFVGDSVRICDTPQEDTYVLWDDWMGRFCGAVGEVVEIHQDNTGAEFYSVKTDNEVWGYDTKWLTIVERKWQKNTGEQPVDSGVYVEYKQRDMVWQAERAGNLLWKETISRPITEWRIADNSCSSLEQPEAIPPSHVALGGEIVSAKQDKKHSHYFKKCGYDYVDVYRILKMFDVTDPCISHACKKLLVSGGRGFKDIDHDIQDVIDTLVRWQEMRKEDSDA